MSQSIKAQHSKDLINNSKALHSLMVSVYTPSRSLRSEKQHFLCLTKTKYKSKGDRAFARACPKLWNKLSLAIRSAKSLHVQSHAEITSFNRLMIGLDSCLGYGYVCVYLFIYTYMQFQLYIFFCLHVLKELIYRQFKKQGSVEILFFQ